MTQVLILLAVVLCSGSLMVLFTMRVLNHIANYNKDNELIHYRIKLLEARVNALEPEDFSPEQLDEFIDIVQGMDSINPFGQDDRPSHRTDSHSMDQIRKDHENLKTKI